MKFRKKLSGLMAVILICVMTGCCSADISEPAESDMNKQTVNSEQTETTLINDNYEVDYLKISPMIEDNVGKDVTDAALSVIRAFLNYETSAEIVISSDKSRFLNDMGYVIDCTCPLFSAFTDYNEMTSYNEENGRVTWDFFVSRDEFQKAVSDFTQTAEEYLSVIDKNDSEAMKAILLYYTMICDASYDYEILGDAYETMDKARYNLRESSYNVLVNKSGICTNLTQALMFLYTQADLTSGTVLHHGGSGSHMWSVVKIDGKYYYCDPTWDVGDGPKTFGITAEDRSSWAGGYAKKEGTMLSAVIDEKYAIDDVRFSILRQKLPAEITDIKIDKTKQTITFVGYDYEYTFCCIQ